jgi:pimeloyl-ACP methyl ester carboxylesterase
MTDFVLDGTSAKVDLGKGFTLKAPGMTASGKTTDGRPTRGARSTAQELPALDAALAATDVVEIRQVELTDVRTQPASGPTRGMRAPGGEDALELEVPQTSADQGCIVLSVVDGALTWHVPLNDDNSVQPPTTRGGGGARYVFRIPNTAPPTGKAGTQRGIIGAVGKKLLKVLIYPITDPLLGPIGEHFARKWETKKRPYGIRTMTPDNFQKIDAGAFTDADWATMGSGRALLFVHGTFSTAHGGFAQLPKAAMRELSDLYGGRVFAYNHFSLTDDPQTNAQEFFKRIPADVTLDVDIICHSRGGLVSRALAEHAPDAPDGSGKMRVGSIVFVGTPNAGTLLAHPDHMMHMIDRYTTALNVLPTGPVEEILEALITTVKIIAHATMKSLDGLMSMNPDGKYLGAINKPGDVATKYFAVASNFEPNTPESAPLKTVIKNKVGDAIVDKIFKDQPNDLVVPTNGVFTSTGPSFPLGNDHCLIFPSDRAIWHSAYFEQPETMEKLREWLLVPAQVPVA